MGEPKTIVHAIGERARRDEITNVQHHSLLSPGGGDYLDPELAGKYSHVSLGSLRRLQEPEYKLTICPPTTARYPIFGEKK